MKCVLVKLDDSDWWLIERAEHDGREWMEDRSQKYGFSVMCFMRSARLGECDIEGTGEQMAAIAAAIERGESESFKRVSAEHTEDGYLMCSPRNSNGDEILISHDEARDLAADIRRKLAQS